MDVFSEDKLNKIFKCYEDTEPFKIISRESTTLEFKANFNTVALPKYAKTMAGFANREGGYLIFGVRNNPRMVVGMRDNVFENYDDEKFTEKLSALFSPEINYSKTTIKYKTLDIGLIYVYPSSSKPVVCTAVHNEGQKQILREGAIYYRYRAKTSEIKYPDLKIMLEDVRNQEKILWMKTFSKIAKIGVNNISLLDLTNGHLLTNNKKNTQIFINEDLLSQIKLIKEGEFSEKEGAPTLKIIGEVQNISSAIVKPTKVVKEVVPTNVTEKYLLETFINQTGTQSPLNYIDAFCHFSVKYLPFYYFIYIQQQNDKEFNKRILKSEIAKITEDSKQGKRYLLERLKNDDNFSPESLTGKDADLKNKYFTLLNDKNTQISEISHEDIDIQLRIILNIKDKEHIKKIIIPLLKQYLDKYYETNKSTLRKAISYIDKLLYEDYLVD